MVLNEVGNALTRLIGLAKRDTGQSTRGANFFAAWMNAAVCGRFDFSTIGTRDGSVAQNMRTVVHFLFDVNFKYPVNSGHKVDVLEIARRHR